MTTTELQFLIDLLLNHKLNPATKKIIADRIGDVEIALRQIVPRGTSPQPTIAFVDPKTAQAPSTQRLLERDGPPTPTPIVGAVVAPAMPATARIVGGEVNTGKGIKGPRKF